MNPEAGRPRYRLVDFNADEACPNESDNDLPTDQGTASGEDEVMREEEEEQCLEADHFSLSLPGPGPCSFLCLGRVGNK